MQSSDKPKYNSDEKAHKQSDMSKIPDLKDTYPSLGMRSIYSMRQNDTTQPEVELIRTVSVAQEEIVERRIELAVVEHKDVFVDVEKEIIQYREIPEIEVVEIPKETVIYTQTATESTPTFIDTSVQVAFRQVVEPKLVQDNNLPPKYVEAHRYVPEIVTRDIPVPMAVDLTGPPHRSNVSMREMTHVDPAVFNSLLLNLNRNLPDDIMSASLPFMQEETTGPGGYRSKTIPFISPIPPMDTTAVHHFEVTSQDMIIGNDLKNEMVPSQYSPNFSFPQSTNSLSFHTRRTFPFCGGLFRTCCDPQSKGQLSSLANRSESSSYAATYAMSNQSSPSTKLLYDGQVLLAPPCGSGPVKFSVLGPDGKPLADGVTRTKIVGMDV